VESIPRNKSATTGEEVKARELVTANTTLKRIKRESHLTTPDEQQALSHFGGFGAVALSLTPNPVKGTYGEVTWQTLGEHLKQQLTPEEYDSAMRTTFCGFDTSPAVNSAKHDALARLVVPSDATALEPGSATGSFMAADPESMCFIGVELVGLSGHIARALHPGADVRIKSYAELQLPAGSVDCVIGNPPFADIKLNHHVRKLPRHDFFIAKSLDALKRGGVLALVTSHFTLDKQNAAARAAIVEGRLPERHLAARLCVQGAGHAPSPTSCS
jgi:hypothetical protein